MVAQIRLGDMLLANHLISQQQLDKALAEQKETGAKLGQVLVSLGIISKQQFLDFLSQQLRIPFFDLSRYQIDPEIVSVLSEASAQLYRAIVLEKTEAGYLVGMSDPLDVVAMDKLRHLIKKPLTFALVNEEDLVRIYKLAYRHTEEIKGHAEALSKELQKDGSRSITTNLNTSLKSDAPVLKLLESLFEDATQMNASDIHIEPHTESVRIRLRIDGILHEQVLDETLIMPAITSRLKLSAGLNIAEKRLPQDGRFEISVSGRRYDVRLSTMPTPYGESIVMRLLKQSEGILNLEQTGMSGDILTRFRALCHRPHGIILVTGPTGSGKSTTLYAAMSEINRPEIQVITIEDPIEYFLSWAVQIQTNEVIGLTFATVLRGILRHDPDVILLGEMRDKETSDIAMRTALTGRLVLSTLHTNDTISTVYRLMDLKVENYIIASTIQGILAQRLLRAICSHCKVDYQLSEQEKSWLSKSRLDIQSTFKHGKGCTHCSNTGYFGRVAAFELFEFTEEISEALRQNNQQVFHELSKKNMQGRLLIDDALRLVSEGQTTVTEVMRVISEADILS